MHCPHTMRATDPTIGAYCCDCGKVFKLSKARRIAQIAEKYMAANGLEVVVWGDGALVSIGRRAGYETEHPIDVMQKVVNALARTPDRFAVFHFRGCDSRARRRITRGFRLVRSTPNDEAGFMPASQPSTPNDE